MVHFVIFFINCNQSDWLQLFCPSLICHSRTWCSVPADAPRLTADSRLYISLHKHTSSTAVSRRRATTVSTLFWWGYTNPAVSPPLAGSAAARTASHRQSVWGLSRYVGSDTQAAGRCVHLELPLIQRQRSGADIGGGPTERKISCGEVALKSRSIMCRGNLQQLGNVFLFRVTLCHGDIFLQSSE